jgi:hypothetical protein
MGSPAPPNPRRSRNLLLAVLVLVGSAATALGILGQEQIAQVELLTRDPAEPAPVPDLNRPLPSELAARQQPPRAKPGTTEVRGDRVGLEPVFQPWSDERLAKLRAPAPGDPGPYTPFETQKMPDLRDQYHVRKETKGLENEPIQMMLTSYPPGMKVKVDGVVLGVTPLMRLLKPGTKSVEVSLTGAGFRTVQQTVKADAEGRIVLAAVMDRVEP